MKINRLLLATVSALLLLFQSNAQLNKDMVAKIGDRDITAREFVLRYEMTPKFIAHVKGAVDGLKEELIYTVAAEKLFALEAERMRLDTIKDVAKRIEQFEKMFALDALFKTEITDKIDQSQQALSNELAKALTKVRIKAIRNIDAEQIKNVYGFLRNGIPFDSLFVSIYGNDRASNELTMTYGMFDRDIEDLIYSKKPGEFTEPVQFNEMWYIFYVDSKRDTVMKDSKAIENEFARVKKLYVERMTDKYYSAFKKEFFKGLKVTTDGNAFNSLSGRFYEVLADAVKKDSVFASAMRNGELFNLDGDYFYKTKAKMPADSVAAAYFTHEGITYPVSEFIYFLAGDVRTIESVNRDKLAIKLRNWTRDFIEYELLAKEAFKRALHKNPEVRREFNIWRDFVLSNAYQMQYVDSAKISDSEVMDYFIRRNSGQSGGVNIKLIRAISDDLDKLSELLGKLDAGDDFATLAAAINGDKNDEINGNSDKFIPAVDYGESGTMALKLNPGRVFGPVKTGDKYMIIKLVDKKTGDIAFSQDFEAVKDKLKRDLGWQKYFKTMTENTANLAIRYNTQIDMDKIKNLKVTETNSVYYRYMGFGGRITAYPLAKPYTEWVESWLKQKQLNP